MKVGDYVRFKTLSREIKIGKVIEIVEPDKESMKKYCVYDLDNNEATVDDYVIKSSPSIIDLIEVGDICTFEVVDIDNYEDYIGKHTEVINQDELEDFKDMIQNESAKLISIVTKERFSQMEYRIGE